MVFFLAVVFFAVAFFLAGAFLAEDFLAAVFLAGARSLALRRRWDDGVQTGTDLEKHLPCDPSRRHTAVAWVRGKNAPWPRVYARFYEHRWAGTPLSSEELADPVSGDFAWTRQWRDLDTPADATYFDVRCGAWPPNTGEGLAWFDELAMIEWEPWQAAGANTVPSPNNMRFVQVRRAGSDPQPAVLAWRAIPGPVPRWMFPPNEFPISNPPTNSR